MSLNVRNHHPNILILFILFIQLVILTQTAQAAHTRLLAVSQENGTFVGRVADLYLEIKPGSGHVFMDTFPLTKLDTQISTRFAKEIACRELDIDCSKYDFFYIIRASSPIVGGPSASAAIAALTYAELSGWKVRDDVAITGTINSGALIGPVGGLKEKIKAASKYGIKRVLIPEIELNTNLLDYERTNITPGNASQESNETTNKTAKTAIKTEENEDLIVYGEKLGVNVTPISELSEAIFYFTGKNISKKTDLTLDTTEYDAIMKMLAEQLCNRSRELKSEVKLELINKEFLEDINKLLEESDNLTEKAKLSFKNKRYYASASYCFGANVKLSTILKIQDDNLNYTANILAYSIDIFERALKNRNLTTINQLQAYIISEERILEAKDYLKNAFKLLKEGDTMKAAENLAFAEERLMSAGSWQAFFSMKGKSYNLDTSELEKSCLSKIGEAQEAYQYVSLFLPISIENIHKKINDANSEASKGNYELCLYKASKAKADLDLILSTRGIKDSQIDELITKKLEAAKRNIIKETSRGIFPIMAYSYYQYADSLKESDIFSSLLYAEYAIELSNIDIYFKPSEHRVRFYIEKVYLSLLFSGFLLGCAFTIIIFSIFTLRSRIRLKSVKKLKALRRRIKAVESINNYSRIKSKRKRSKKRKDKR